MKRIFWNQGVILLMTLLLFSCQKNDLEETSGTALEIAGKKKSLQSATLSVYATGLNNPRGLEFGPDGMLYVAEGGLGGTNSTAGICEQVGFPGPFFGSETGGRISKISDAGIRTTVTDQLPSTVNIIGDVIGVSDVTFIGNTLYALLGGAGCSHGVTTFPNGLFRINSDGSHTLIADLSAWARANPVENPAEDFEPDGVWYSMENVKGTLYALEPNRGELVKISLDGTITRVSDISASEGHIVPTALAHHGNFFVGNLGTFPIQEGSSSIYKVNPDGVVKEWVKGFSTILGLVIDQQKRMYVLETTVGAPFPNPGLGRITMVHPSGKKEIVISGLNLPSSMTMGPDGNLYVSVWGFGPPALGGGQVVKITLGN